MKIDGDGLLKAINWELTELQKEIDSSVAVNWYEKAAKLHIKREGVESVRSMIHLGDHVIRE